MAHYVYYCGSCAPASKVILHTSDTDVDVPEGTHTDCPSAEPGAAITKHFAVATEESWSEDPAWIATTYADRFIA